MIGLGPLACSPSTASISKLLFEHYVWVDPQTVFVSNPSDLLGALRHAPLHVPLEVEAAKVGPSVMLDGVPASRYGEIMRQCGFLNPVFHQPERDLDRATRSHRRGVRTGHPGLAQSPGTGRNRHR